MSKKLPEKIDIRKLQPSSDFYGIFLSKINEIIDYLSSEGEEKIQVSKDGKYAKIGNKLYKDDDFEEIKVPENYLGMGGGEVEKKESWEEEYRKKFVDVQYIIGDPKLTIDFIHNLLSQTLQDYKEKLLKEIEELRIDINDQHYKEIYGQRKNDEKYQTHYIHNKLIDSVLSLITSPENSNK